MYIQDRRSLDMEIIYILDTICSYIRSYSHAAYYGKLISYILYTLWHSLHLKLEHKY